MDALKLLSRSTKLSRNAGRKTPQPTPSSGQAAQPQLFADAIGKASHTRKRSASTVEDGEGEATSLDFFGGSVPSETTKRRKIDNAQSIDAGRDAVVDTVGNNDLDLPVDECKSILRQHKLKITQINRKRLSKKGRTKAGDKVKNEKVPLYPQPLQSFRELHNRYGTSKSLQSRIADQGYTVPTEVQLGALPLLLDQSASYLAEELHSAGNPSHQTIDLLTVAPTGSGKTLAFMIPLLHMIQRRRKVEVDAGRQISALVLAPTKELVGQIVNEGRKLVKNSAVRIAQARKGMRLGRDHEALEDEEDDPETDKATAPAVKADILVSTPGLMQSLIAENARASEALSAVRFMVLDEADVLLDPLFREQTLAVWNGLSNPDLRVSLWSATMGSNVEELAQDIIEGRRARLDAAQSAVVDAPLVRLVVGLKDSAVPNVEHKLIYAATEQGKLMGLRQLLHPTSTAAEAGPALRPPFLIFTQTIERAIALHAELLYDIPAEAGGISRIAVLHSDLSDSARDSVMTRFRKGEIWVLITTDLLSRGVDFRGINGVVNYDIPTSSAAYVHRVGRTGRAGRQGGVAVTLYSAEDIPYLKHVANVVSAAQSAKGGQEPMQQWLLDALPKLSKNDKRNLKKHGIESRTARGRDKNPSAARKARISTKAGYVRREENKRRGAIEGSRRRAQAENGSDDGGETDFGGFD